MEDCAGQNDGVVSLIFISVSLLLTADHIKRAVSFVNIRSFWMILQVKLVDGAKGNGFLKIDSIQLN